MLITQCPDCHSLFRVSHGQLKLAEGKVRCGACLRVFDAREHALEKANQTTFQETPTEPHVPREPELTQPPVSRGHDSTARVVQFREKQHERQQTDAVAESQLESEQVPEAPSEQPEPPKPIHVSNTQPSPTSSFDAARIPDLNIEVEPLLLRAEMPEETSPGTVLLWMFASILALTILLTQYLWFERATLASQPNLAGLYQLACERIPCKLQSLEGLKTLQAEQVIVRPHQMFADLISLSIKLRNSAAFEQPYPALEITFSDLKGDLVTRRTFQPRDYLPAYQLGSSLPAGLDLEINLPLTDPGSSAVSYAVELRQSR